MSSKRRLWFGLLLAVGLVLISAALAGAAGYYDAYNWTVQQRLGIGTRSPSSALHIDFGKTGEILGGTPLGNGPGWTFYAANGDRRDFTAWNGGIYIGISSTSRAPSAQFVICEGGNVGIGSSSCPRNILAVVRGSRYDPVADAWTTYSSRAYKSDIQELSAAEHEEALQALLDTRLVRFRFQGQDADAKLKLGVIAEEAPEAILAEGDPQAVSVNEYVSLLHAAIKAQQAQIEAQQQQIEQLQATLDKLTR